jgi:hypothetical protein
MSYQENLIKVYFSQREYYMSQSKDEPVPVSDMHARHADNAADKLLRDAEFWAGEVGGRHMRNPRVWMARQPLFQALSDRAAQAAR